MITSLILLFCLLFSGCNTTDQNHENPWTEISGRDDYPILPAIKRYPVYRAKVPKYWKKEEFNPTVSNYDTTKPLCEFIIRDGLETCKISIHNFPSMSIEERIPPMAQIQRWKRQLENIEASSVAISPQAFSGFSGFLFEGQGFYKGQETKIIGWSLQLGRDQYHALQLNGSEEEERFFKQMRSDVTIKALGNPDMMDKHKDEIIAFARSFELIQDIPSE